MTENKKRLLKIRRNIGQKRPDFIQFEAWRYKKLQNKWRRPRGIDNKMRQERKGWPRVVKVGWRSPKKVRGLHPLGKQEVMVYNEGDLTLIDPDVQDGRIGGSIGNRKRLKILEEANRLQVKILNPGKLSLFKDVESEDEE